MLVDTHAHIADAKFEADRDAVIVRAQNAGVTTLIEIAESPDMWDAAIRLAESHPFIYASLGSGLFGVLTWLSVATALCAGLFFTSDCLSEEKREGTLGFLFLTDLRDFHYFDQVWKEFFPSPPPRTTVQVSGLLVPGCRVEIDLTAVLP